MFVQPLYTFKVPLDDTELSIALIDVVPTAHILLFSFNPVEVEDLSKHKMDSEEIDVDINATTIINKALKEKRRICAVGTTSYV